MLRTHSDVPTSYQYGAPLSRLVALTIDAGNWLGLAVPTVDDESGLRWIARIISVIICSTGTIAVGLAAFASWAHETSHRWRVGLYSATAYAFCYELVTHARYGVTDAIYIALFSWSLAGCAFYFASRRIEVGITMVVLAGLAFAFKPTAIPCILPALLTLVLVAPRDEHPRLAFARRALLIGAVPIFFACFLYFNPHYIDRWQDALGDLSARIAQTRNGGFPKFTLRRPGIEHSMSALSGLLGHTFSRNIVLSWVAGSVAMMGLLVAAKKRYTIVGVALTHAATATLLVTLTSKTFLLRNYLVAAPVLCVGLGIGTDYLQEILSRKRPWLGTLATLPLVSIAVATLVHAISSQQMGKDARERAVDAIVAAQYRPGITVAITPSVIGQTALGFLPQSATAIQRNGIRLITVSSCDDLQHSNADFAVTASYRGDERSWKPYRHAWHFRQCRGFETIGTFQANPYEHTFWVTETWDGRVDAIALRRRHRLPPTLP